MQEGILGALLAFACAGTLVGGVPIAARTGADLYGEAVSAASRRAM
jgi:hypothetical protein